VNEIGSISLSGFFEDRTPISVGLKSLKYTKNNISEIKP